MYIIYVTGELLLLEVGGNPRWWTLISSTVTQAAINTVQTDILLKIKLVKID